MSNLFAPLPFASGKAMKNRFMLAPLTNLQSHNDGVLSDDEYRWLTMRAAGEFGATMTCASHVQAAGKGFPGQLGCFSETDDGRHVFRPRPQTSFMCRSHEEGLYWRSLSYIECPHPLGGVELMPCQGQQVDT